jgi:ribokinase
MEKPDVVVVGSLSRDLVVHTSNRPRVGETVIGNSFNMYVGGKGNNQAIAATRAGACVEIIGKIGQDSFGDIILDVLKENKVGHKYLFRDKNLNTGIANIIVDDHGDNSIVIVPGTNHALSSHDVDSAIEIISSTKVILLQLEIQLATALHAAKLARNSNVTVILNPAPAVEDINQITDLLKHIDILIPNEIEASVLTGIDISDEKTAFQAAKKLMNYGPKTIVITLGAKGALYVIDSGEYTLIPAYAVKAIDTTAAGDAFCGALAAHLSQDGNLERAIKFASAAGALAVTKGGAEPSLPLKEDILDLMSTKVV